MRQQLLAAAIVLPLAPLLFACASSTPPPEAPEANADTAANAVSETEETAPTDLQLAQDVAQSTLPAWDAEKAEKEDAVFTLKITVNGKPSALSSKGAELSVLGGADAAAAADFTIELSAEQAQAIIDGSQTLKTLIESGATEADNSEGLSRFAEFLQN